MFIAELARQNKLETLLRELAAGYSQHTAIRMGGAHGIKEISGMAVVDIVEAIDGIGGPEALARFREAITPISSEPIGFSQLSERLHHLSKVFNFEF